MIKMQDKYYFLACAFQRDSRRTNKNLEGRINFTEKDMTEIETRANALRAEHTRRLTMHD